MKDFNEWKQEAHRLRTGMFAAEGAFFLHLLEGETLFEDQHLGITYDEFLVDEALVKSERWRAFREATLVVDAKKVVELGYSAFVELGRRQTPEKRAAYEDNVRAFIREHNHPPSEERAKEMARIVDPPPPRNTQALEREMSLAKLKAENEALRRENARLRARVEELEGKRQPKKTKAR